LLDTKFYISLISDAIDLSIATLDNKANPYAYRNLINLCNLSKEATILFLLLSNVLLNNSIYFDLLFNSLINHHLIKGEII